MNQVIAAVLMLLVLVGCGVKGRPLPPLEPVRPGEGRLLYEKQEEEKKKRQQPSVDQRTEGP